VRRILLCSSPWRAAGALGLLLGLAAAPQLAAAQQYSLYLLCKGQMQVKGKNKPAHLDLALRDNNETALVQRSNVLPVGERMKYQASPAFYSMKMGFANRSAAFYDWWRGTLIVWQPDLKRLAEVRISVDRQSAELQGELVDGAGESLGLLAMQCDPKTHATVAEPKF
jgi:hypothetical protein